MSLKPLETKIAQCKDLAVRIWGDGVTRDELAEVGVFVHESSDWYNDNDVAFISTALESQLFIYESLLELWKEARR